MRRWENPPPPAPRGYSIVTAEPGGFIPRSFDRRHVQFDPAPARSRGHDHVDAEDEERQPDDAETDPALGRHRLMQHGDADHELDERGEVLDEAHVDERQATR